MRTIARRLIRLEATRAAIAQGPTVAQSIMECRRRRLEASGQPFVLPPVDYTGCRTIADRIRRTREAHMKRHQTKERIR